MSGRLHVLTDKEVRDYRDLDRDPVCAIVLRMVQRNLQQRDLIPYIGSRSRVSEIINRKRRLTVAMIQGLHVHLAIPLAHLLAIPKPRHEVRAAALSVYPQGGDDDH